MKAFLFSLLLFTSFDLLLSQDKVEWLKENSFPIKSLVDSSDFSDLIPLKEILKNKDIIFLGEGTHGDGSTFAAKTRLVRFLHEEMGFNVIVFEGGFFEGRIIDQHIGRSPNPAGTAKIGLFMWPYAKQSRALFPYISRTKKSNTPMHIAGMDCKVGTGNSSVKLFMSTLKMMLFHCKIDSSFINLPVFRSCINNLWRYEMSDRPKGDTAKIFSSDLKRLADTLKIISRSDTSDISAFWAQNLSSIRNSLEMTWHFKKFRFTKFLLKLNALYSIRDIQNAQNLEWLIENRFKGEKIIVWAASIHVMHNLQSIRVKGLKKVLFNFRNFTNTGDVIWKKYGSRTYTIGFTAYQGKKNNLVGNKKINFRNGSKRNIEYQLNKLNQNYLFLNFHGGTLPLWINEKMKSGICGYGNEISIIPATVDGLFFIRKMEAVEY